MDQFHQHLNTTVRSVTITEKEEKDSTLPLLDILIMGQPNGSIDITACKTPMTTKPHTQLRKQPSNLPLNGVYLSRSTSLLHTSLHGTYRNKSSLGRSNCLRSTDIQNLSSMPVFTENRRNTNKIKSTVVLPSIQGVSEAVECIPRPPDITVVHKSTNTLRPNLFSEKDASTRGSLSHPMPRV